MLFEKKPSGKSSARRKAKSTPARQHPAKPLLTPDQYIDLIGYGCIALAGLTILSVLSPGGQGELTTEWKKALTQLFGWGMLIAPAIMGMFGFYLVVRRFGDRFPRPRLSRLIGIVLLYLAILASLHVVGMNTQPDGQALAEQGNGGGLLGLAVLNLLIGAVGNVGAIIVLAVMWVVALMLIVSVSLAQVIDSVQYYLAQRQEEREPGGGTGVIVPPWDREAEREPGDLVINGLKPRRNARNTPRPQDDLDAIDINANPRPIAPPPQAITPPISARKPAAQQQPTIANSQKLMPPRIIGGPDSFTSVNTAGAASAAQRHAAQSEPTITSRIETQRVWTLPSVEQLLEPGSDATLKEADIRMRAQTIEDTLNAFGVPGRVVEVNRGPTITQFGVEPGFIEMKGGKQVKVKVSRIAGLSDDLALALSAPRIRIEAPVPGRAIVGIEVPNGETSLVSLRDVMESEEFAQLAHKTKLRLGLGQDVSGHPVVADLTGMPHLLIAGTTGSGKSVCVNAIIAAMLSFNTPEDLRLLMVDPKRVELTGYNGIPHLIAPVVVDLEKVGAVLHWVTREMENRYRTFAKHGARNIVDFNQKVADFSGQTRPDDLKKLPYIVVVIDELADLMMMAPDETEKTICRLAQMARATGIHLIIATQRPSVDVVTGLIKANFPARIAFTVATSIDSRVILDSPGAEKLLGRGDMLVVRPEASLPVRAQGCWVSDKEITRIVRHWRAQVGGENAGRDPITASMTAPSIPMTGTLDGGSHPAPVMDTSFQPTWDEARALQDAATTEGGGNKDDKLYQDAVATVRLQGKASISLLQRRLRIGYTRSARLIEQMEERGIVGPNLPGSQFREVLRMRDDPNEIGD